MDGYNASNSGIMTSGLRPTVLDLFCGAGGASAGYAHYGFDVVGVDIKPQPRYPFRFIQSDAIKYAIQHGHNFDIIHASPPCQRYSNISKSWNGKPNSHPDLIPTIRTLLESLDKPYIIENVVGSPLINPIMLCGSMFQLRVYRHRLFESNLPIFSPKHFPHSELCFTMDKRKPHYGKLNEMESYVQVTGGGNCSVKAAKSAMGIDWMNKAELNESIPPAYTRYIAGIIGTAIEAKEQAAP